jgi:hypothetical protein
MADVTGKSADLLVEPPVRLREGLDVSFEDVPYPVVPAFNRRPVVHLAVECEGVDWNHGMSIRVLVRTRCGKTNLFADRRCMYWVAKCRRCFPPPGPAGGDSGAV